jgi:eukaryotic-like serine/threonine-protein kinase
MQSSPVIETGGTDQAGDRKGSQPRTCTCIHISARQAEEIEVAHRGSVAEGWWPAGVHRRPAPPHDSSHEPDGSLESPIQVSEESHFVTGLDSTATGGSNVAHALEQLKQALAERYSVDRELGRGGMATVYLAEDLKHHRKVAIKVLKPELAALLGPGRFLREITLTAQLDHPHILPLLDSGDADGFLYYVMPYVEGETLRDRLNREKQLPLEDALQIAREVADALGYAHSQGILHRDIKPENILLAGGHARVADFGIGLAVTAAGGASLTETGIAVGTPTYMSPEQAGGDRMLDARSDLYSLGCVVYEMLAGQPPYTGATPEAILARKSLEPVPSLRVIREALPPGVEEAISRALSKVPADRFVTAAQFMEALERGRGAFGSLSPSKRRLGWRLAVAAAGLVLIAGGWWLSTIAFRPLDPTRPRANASAASIAVLPFANLSRDVDQEWFSDGVTEALIAELSRIHALKVISRTSVARYRGTTQPLPEIARALGVRHVVEGSALLVGDRVRITAQLIDAETDRHLWAESYERSLEDILGVHRDVTHTIARAVGVALTPQESRRLARAESVSPEAYQLVMKGRYHQAKGALGLRSALEAFEEAARIAPEYAAAHAGIGETYGLLGNYGLMEQATAQTRARDAALRAIELDPESADAHRALSFWHYTWNHDWVLAERQITRALELDPNDVVAHSYHASWLSLMGRHDEAIRAARHARDLAPLDIRQQVWLGRIYHFARRLREAEQAFADALAFDPDWAEAYGYASLNYLAQGKYDEAVQMQVMALRVVRLDDVAENLANAYRSGGYRAYVREQLPFQGRYPEGMTASLAHVSGWTAMFHAQLGERDEAFAQLEITYREHGSWLWQLHDPVWDPIRDDPRFADLLRRLNLASSAAAASARRSR